MGLRKIWNAPVKDLFTRKQARVRRRPANYQRSFSGAKGGNLVASWTSTPTNIDSALVGGLSALRARSRDLMRNDPHARRFRSMVQGNVVGPRGIGFSSLVANPGKGNTPDSAARDSIESGWKSWLGKCDFKDQMHLVDIERLLMGIIPTDGEAFIRLRRGSGYFGLQLEIIDSELIDVRHNASLPDGRKIVMGVEKDAAGRVLAYHVGEPPPSAYSPYYTMANNPKRIPADEMRNLFVREEAGQTRGIPWMAAVMLRLNMLDGYMEAALVAARTGAAKALAIITADGDYIGDDVDDDGSPIIDLSAPGVAWNLRDGQRIETYDPSYPHGEMESFIKICLREVASGVGYGVSYNLMSGDLEGVSFSSIRHAIIEEQGQWMAIQEWMIRTFMQPIFDEWVFQAVGRGALTIGTNPLRVKDMDRYERCAWQPRRWQWIDPLKDVTANIKAIEAGLKSRSDVIRDISERDPDDVWSEVEAENMKLQEHGVLENGANGEKATI